MSPSLVDTTRLDRCGWNSFRSELFTEEPGRKRRDVTDEILSLLQDFSPGKRILELCSGTGALARSLARHGFTVTGLDLKEEMVEIARMTTKAEERSTQDRLKFIQGDMATFDLEEHFDFVILEDDGFCYLLTTDDQISCLSQVRKHLVDGGHFFFRFETPDRELTRSYDTYDPLQQIITKHCVWDAPDGKGGWTPVEEGFERRRLTYPCELDLLLRMTELETVQKWGNLSPRKSFDDPVRQDYNCLVRRSAYCA